MSVGDHRAAALGRALNKLTIDAVQSKDKRVAADATFQGGDTQQMFQLKVDGTAGQIPSFTEIKVAWEQEMIQGIDASLSTNNLPTPHFSEGVETLSSGLVIVQTQVRDWSRSDGGWYTGATIRVVAWAPGAFKPSDFSAIIHLSFVGYAAPSYDDNEG